jgi:hypothetical protein
MKVDNPSDWSSYYGWNEQKKNCKKRCKLDTCDLDKGRTAKFINLQKCRLKEIPSDIKYLPNLEIIKLNGNKITDINNIPKTVRGLDLSSNKIKKVENLPNLLKVLDLSGNKIEELNHGDIPDSVERLDIGLNRISAVGGNLPINLKSLVVSYQWSDYLDDYLDTISIKGQLPPNLSYVRAGQAFGHRAKGSACPLFEAAKPDIECYADYIGW